MGSGQLIIRGSRLTLFDDGVATDAEQTINVGERALVRTCFGDSTSECGGVLPGDPRVAGLTVLAELRGPELPRPLELQTTPGGTFVLPGFQQEGDYLLENIRLVDHATGQVLSLSDPPVALLHVRQIVLASATVRALSLADLQALGVNLDQENFQAFNFAVGFAFENEIVEIEFPLVYNGFGTVAPLFPPRVRLEGLSENLQKVVRRWQPPHIVPFKLEIPEQDLQKPGVEELEDLVLPMFGAIVIPGTVTFLNQFFDAELVVANGAPAGSGAQLHNVTGTLRLPRSNVLRLGRTTPPVGPGQAVPVVQPNGSSFLDPGEQGAASWTLEGLVAGTHTLLIDIEGELLRPGRDPFAVMSRAQAAVDVVDARFNLTFAHPDVVREGEAYSMFVTVTNLSQVTQNLITVDLTEQNITGAHPEDPGDPLQRTIDTLAPGRAETLEYRLVADLNGKVVATTFQSTSVAGQGSIVLQTGVGELGIPLSPATLILPRYTEYLETPHLSTDDLVRAQVRLLGLAYSLAVAPAGLTPPGLPRVIRSDVERRAIDLAEAGQRIFLQEEPLESLMVLALDALGNREPLEEFDELRRLTDKGLAAGEQLGAVLRAQQQTRALDALDFFDLFAEATSYADPYMAVMFVPTSGPPVRLELFEAGAAGPEQLFGTASDPELARTLPFGEVWGAR